MFLKSVGARKSINALSHFSVGCSSGRDPPMSGLLTGLRHHTTNTCHCIGVRTILGTSPLARVQTSVVRTWLREAPHCSLGWVCCFQLCLSVYSRGAYCICWPPNQRSPPSLLLIFVWSCSQPRCIFLRVLFLVYGPLSLDSLYNLLPKSWGCQCNMGSSGFLSQCRFRRECLTIG
jgi:hypothetical protein